MRIPAIGLNPWKFNSDGYIYRADGYVGIKTDAPTEALHVSGWAIANDPVLPTHLTTKAYVDAKSTSALEDLSLTVDPVNGTDLFTPASYTTQSQITAHGSFATIDGAIAVLPDKVLNITITIVDGAYTWSSLGDYQRFVVPDNKQILIKSSSIFTRVSGTSTYAVASSSEINTQTTVAFVSDPGFTTDAYQNYFMRGVSGTSAGQYVPIRSHSGTSWVTVRGWWDNPDATSIVEIVKPAVAITMSSSINVRGNERLFVSSDFGATKQFKFKGLEFLSANGLAFYGMELELDAFKRNGGSASLNNCNTNLTSTINTGGTRGWTITGGNAQTLVAITGTGTLISDKTISAMHVQITAAPFKGPANANFFRIAADRITGSGIAFIVSGRGSRLTAINTGFTGTTPGTRVFQVFEGGEIRLSTSTANFPSGSTADIQIDGQDYSYATIASFAGGRIFGAAGSFVSTTFSGILGPPTANPMTLQATNISGNLITSGSFKIGAQNIQPVLDGYAVKAARTKSSFVMTVDPASGRDPDAYGFVTNQAQADSWGSFATVVGATRALPDHIMHRVAIQLTDGYHTVTDASIFGDLSRFTFGWGAPGELEAINDEPRINGHIAIKSLNGYVRVANTSVYTVSSMPDSSNLILTTDPGFPSNTFRGCFIRLITGTATGGSGNIWVKAIRSHSGITFTIAGRFDGGVTTFEIVQPAAVLLLNNIARAKIAMQEPWSGNSGRSLVLEEIDLSRTVTTGVTILCDYGQIWLRGCRCLRVAWFGANTDFEMNNAVVDGLGVRSIMFTVSSGGITCTSSESSWIVRGTTAYGIFAGSTSSKDGCRVFLFKGALDDNGITGLMLQGNDTFGNNATGIQGTGNGSYGVEVQKGARWEPRLSDFVGVPTRLTGNVADMAIDGITNLSYDEVNVETDKTIIGAKGSIVSGT